jgi:Transmembrane domain of unknown function (DUF3566)
MRTRPRFGEGRCLHLNPVSPSKRVVGTIDASSPDTETVVPAVDNASPGAATQLSSNGPSANGNGSVRAPKRSSGNRLRRRTKLPSAVPAPERGSTSARGTSSSSISKPAPAVPAPSPNGPPAAKPPSDRSGSSSPEPAAPPPRLPASRRGDTVAPVPAVAPVTPAKRGSQVPEFPTTMTLPPTIPVEPPPTSMSMTTHRVAPVPRVVGRRPRVRKVTRVVRHVDPWSVFKIAVVFNLVLYAVTLTSGVLLWNVAYATGTIDNLERFFESFGWNTFEFNGGEIFHSAWIAGLFAVVGLTGAAVLGATLFNLITDLVGGVRLTVLGEEVVERTASPMRRFVVRRPSGDGMGSADQSTHPAPNATNLPTRAQVLDEAPGTSVKPVEEVSDHR